jgi:DNA-binding CsgD family transcriptional regulator/predicted negative regulator of RcsB-dependent stress response
VSDQIGGLLQRGGAELAAGHWSEARTSFEAALQREQSADALFSLGVALWWLGETEPSLRRWAQSFVAFRRRHDQSAAVRSAVYLSLSYQMSLGNAAAARGWLGRAARLVADFGLEALEGWVLLCRAYLATDAGRPRDAATWAREALDAARRDSDIDLQLAATSELGAALLEMGRIEEGANLLDEAMAGALAGEASDLETVVLIGCRVITSCSHAADAKRAIQWVRAADGFIRRYGSSHLFTTCRTHYGAILVATGSWEQAEAELQAALRIGRTAEPALHAETLAQLAELRLAQGRPDEAARLLEGYEDHPVTAHVVAALHLARGAPVVAISVLRRRLGEIDEECLESGALVELLAEGEVACGEAARAAELGRRLADVGRKLTCDPLLARGERVLGRALIASDDPTAAIDHLEAALAAFHRLALPLEVGRTRHLLAVALEETHKETAIAEAQTALATFEELGAARDADAVAAFLRSHGARAARRGARAIGQLSRRELEVLSLLGEGRSNTEIASSLFITRKTAEHHVASVLSKLGLSSRGEAAAYAVRYLERGSTTDQVSSPMPVRRRHRNLASSDPAGDGEEDGDGTGGRTGRSRGLERA